MQHEGTIRVLLGGGGGGVCQLLNYKLNGKASQASCVQIRAEGRKATHSEICDSR